jgi:Immunity protein 53
MSHNIISWIENWYVSQCDSDWEHECGIKINTIDNPGWEIKIDIVNHSYKVNIPWRRTEISDSDWYAFRIHDEYFEAIGDGQKLNFLLNLFKDFIEKGVDSLPDCQIV